MNASRFLFIHFMIGHKELRFLFPALGFVPVIVMQGIQLLENKSGKSLIKKKWVQKAATLFVWINSLLILFICTTSFDRTTPLYRFVYYHYPEPTTLYYLGTDPYKQNHLPYYKRSNLKIIEIKSVDELPDSEVDPVLLVVDRPGKLENSDLNKKLIYSSIPGWVWHINFNHWIERTLAWYLFEIPATTEK